MLYKEWLSQYKSISSTFHLWWHLQQLNKSSPTSYKFISRYFPHRGFPSSTSSSRRRSRKASSWCMCRICRTMKLRSLWSHIQFTCFLKQNIAFHTEISWKQTNIFHSKWTKSLKWFLFLWKQIHTRHTVHSYIAHSISTSYHHRMDGSRIYGKPDSVIHVQNDLNYLKLCRYVRCNSVFRTMSSHEKSYNVILLQRLD
jgi:hypothetical protein